MARGCPQGPALVWPHSGTRSRGGLIPLGRKRESMEAVLFGDRRGPQGPGDTISACGAGDSHLKSYNTYIPWMHFARIRSARNVPDPSALAAPRPAVLHGSGVRFATSWTFAPSGLCI